MILTTLNWSTMMNNSAHIIMTWAWSLVCVSRDNFLCLTLGLLSPLSNTTFHLGLISSYSEIQAILPLCGAVNQIGLSIKHCIRCWKRKGHTDNEGQWIEEAVTVRIQSQYRN